MSKEENKGNMTEGELAGAYWLASVEGLGNETRKQMAEYAGSYRAVYEMQDTAWKEVLPEKKRKLLAAEKREWSQLEKRYRELGERGIQFYPITHPLYPGRLKNIADAPYGIFVEGRLPEEKKPAVAVIGARKCSEYGCYVAEVCGRKLAEAGINVISGMARGIDGISQNAALKAGGMSYAVLGCGTNVCYPAENRHIYVSAKKNGGIISEYLPDTQPKPGLFPLRNRIISGLADVIIIIEARNKSGTLITADMALEQGKEIYVVPGRVTDVLSEGCNRLLKQGAGLLLSVEEMLEETGLVQKIKENKTYSCAGEQNESSEKDKVQKKEEKKSIEEKVMNQLDFYPKNAESLGKETGLEYRQVIYILMKLCMEGKAEQVSQGQYIRKMP